MKKHVFKTRVRYQETDQMGFVHNSKYLVYFEEARTDLVRAENYPYKKMEEDGYFFPISEAGLKFMMPLKYDDELEVEVTVSKLKSFSIQFNYTIKKPDGTVCATGHTLHASIDNQNGGFKEISEKIHHLFGIYSG